MLARLRRHWLLVAVALFGVVSLAVFTWSEWGYFCDQAASHKEPCGGFWSAEHVHNWTYNAFANVMSEVLVGILLVVILKSKDEPV